MADFPKYDESEVARVQGVMKEVFADGDRGIGCWPPVEEVQEAFADGDNGGYRMDEDGQIISKEDVTYKVIHEAEALSKRYEERLNRQAANLSALVAKYNAVIAVAEEVIANETAGDLGDEYLEKLEAAKRTGDDVENGKTA